MVSRVSLRQPSITIFRALVVVVIYTLVAFDGVLQSGNREEPLSDFVTPKRIDTNNSFCVPWEINSDEWWTHNPQWEMDLENDNDTHYCFRRIQNEEKRIAILELYKTQFHGNCSQTLTKRMWSSGWNADFSNVMDGLKHAVLHKRPMQIANTPWHYADPRQAKPRILAYNTIPSVCSNGTMFCYFLPISKCPAAPQGDPKEYLEEQFVGTKLYQWYYEYATRRQTWLRKAVYEFAKKQTIATPCTAIHCRRGDVVIHPGAFKRRYHPIRDYMNSTFHVHKNIFLMTDDSNAIIEAETEFPAYNWMYIDRPRFKAAEGGFEMQLPSLDPIHEVVVILAIFQMARKCSQFIHSHSTFAMQVHAEMVASGQDITRIQIDSNTQVFSELHGNTRNVSSEYERHSRKTPSI